MSQRDKPRLALNKITAGVCERSEWSGWPSDIEGKTTRVGASECGQRTSFNRTRVAGHLDEIQGAVANTLNLVRNGAVGFIDWLGLLRLICVDEFPNIVSFFSAVRMNDDPVENFRLGKRNLLSLMERANRV